MGGTCGGGGKYVGLAGGGKYVGLAGGELSGTTIGPLNCEGKYWIGGWNGAGWTAGGVGAGGSIN